MACQRGADRVGGTDTANDTASTANTTTVSVCIEAGTANQAGARAAVRRPTSSATTPNQESTNISC